jgi:sugar phosphate isomerase/epimerase
MKNIEYNRRKFIKGASGLVAGLGLGSVAIAGYKKEVIEKRVSGLSKIEIPENPLVLFDNFHNGNRRSYSWKAKFASAERAGFDGFELVRVLPGSDNWKEAIDLMPETKFKIWGMHWSSKSVLDNEVKNIEADIEGVYELAEACAKTSIEYITMSLSGNGELRGNTIHGSGSAKAEERHWQRAYKIMKAFDQACKKNNIRGSLYPHTHWICDTPQSVEKILNGAGAQTLGPAFCSHHWFANKNSDELDDVFKSEIMKRLNYVVLTNGKFVDADFLAVRFDEGVIDMAWVLAKLIEFGYKGQISSQGYGIGGDPYTSGKLFVDIVKALKERFRLYPYLWPLN